MSIFKIRSSLGLAGHYRRFENGLKLSIRGMIVGFRLLDMDSMVGTALTIEREIEDTWNTRDTGVGSKREEQLSPSSIDRPEGPECGSKSGTDQSCAAEAWWTLG